MKIKKGDWVRSIINRGASIVINYPFKVYFVGYEGIIVEVPKGFHSEYFSPWLGASQTGEIIDKCNLFPDKLYYFFNNWIAIERKLKI